MHSQYYSNKAIGKAIDEVLKHKKTINEASTGSYTDELTGNPNEWCPGNDEITNIESLVNGIIEVLNSIDDIDDEEFDDKFDTTFFVSCASSETTDFAKLRLVNDQQADEDDIEYTYNWASGNTPLFEISDITLGITPIKLVFFGGAYSSQEDSYFNVVCDTKRVFSSDKPVTYKLSTNLWEAEPSDSADLADTIVSFLNDIDSDSIKNLKCSNSS
jgi:hypothetical protein